MFGSRLNSNLSNSSDRSKISHGSIQLSPYDFFKLQSDIKKVQYPTHAISNAQDLDKKIQSFKSVKVREELKRKLSDLNSYRQVRGDGNCFFRALAFSFISSTKDASFKNCFGFIQEVSLTCCFPLSIPQKFQKFYDHKFLLQLLTKNWDQCFKKCLQQSGKMMLKGLLKLFTDYPFLDFIVILYFRAMCLKAFSLYEQEFKEYLVGMQDKAIRTYSEQSEGVIIHLCSKMLKIRIYVFEVRKDEIHAYKYTEDKQIATIYLLFYENHYDIIQINKNIEAENSILRNKQDYYEKVEQNLMKGKCFQCDTNGYIYQQTGLCLKCHEASLSTLQNLSKVDKFRSGKCTSCDTFTQISQSLGFCRKCINIQSQYMNKRQERQSKKSIRGKCQSCFYTETLDPQTKLCWDCTKIAKRAMREMEKKNQLKANTSQIRNTHNYNQYQTEEKYKQSSNINRKIFGSCLGCSVKTDISQKTRYCRQCSNNKQKILNSNNNPSTRYSQKYSQINYQIPREISFSSIAKCKKCEFTSKINPDSHLCKECYPKSKIQNSGLICKACNINYENKRDFFSEGDGKCLSCLRLKESGVKLSQSSYSQYQCRRCSKMSMSGLRNGICQKCR